MRNGIIETAEDMQKIRQIEQLQKKLDIATKALREYANEENWNDIRSYNFAIYDTYFFEKAEFREKGYEPAQKALKEIDLVGTSVSLAGRTK